MCESVPDCAGRDADNCIDSRLHDGLGALLPSSFFDAVVDEPAHGCLAVCGHCSRDGTNASFNGFSAF